MWKWDGTTEKGYVCMKHRIFYKDIKLGCWKCREEKKVLSPKCKKKKK